MAELLSEGFYWIKRNEPDGPCPWEPAQFRHKHYVQGEKQIEDGGPCWYVIGQGRPQFPPLNPMASNSWKIGPRVEADIEHFDLVAKLRRQILEHGQDITRHYLDRIEALCAKADP